MPSRGRIATDPEIVRHHELHDAHRPSVGQLPTIRSNTSRRLPHASCGRSALPLHGDRTLERGRIAWQASSSSGANMRRIFRARSGLVPRRPLDTERTFRHEGWGSARGRLQDVQVGYNRPSPVPGTPGGVKGCTVRASSRPGREHPACPAKLAQVATVWLSASWAPEPPRRLGAALSAPRVYRTPSPRYSRLHLHRRLDGAGECIIRRAFPTPRISSTPGRSPVKRGVPWRQRVTTRKWTSAAPLANRPGRAGVTADDRVALRSTTTFRFLETLLSPCGRRVAVPLHPDGRRGALYVAEDSIGGGAVASAALPSAGGCWPRRFPHHHVIARRAHGQRRSGYESEWPRRAHAGPPRHCSTRHDAAYTSVSPETKACVTRRAV